MSTNVIKVAVKPWLKLIWLSGFLILAVCPVVAFLKSTGMERMIQILIFQQTGGISFGTKRSGRA